MMKKALSVTVFLLMAALSDAYGGYEWNGACTTDEPLLKERKKSLAAAAASEKAGKLIEALGGYYDAFLDCNVNEPVSREAIEGARRVGQKLGAQEEKNGNLYCGTEKCIGAFGWYEASLHYGDADRVMMEVARKTEDTEIFEGVVVHFNHRKESEEKLKKRSPAYTFNAGYLKELEGLPSKRIDNALKNEEKEFLKKAIDAGGTPGNRSIGYLTLARQWTKVFNDPKEVTKVIEKAEKRGDSLYAVDEPLSLEDAIRYYKFTDNQGKVQKVKDKANRLGALNEKNGILLPAIEYYEIAENGDKAHELREKMKKMEKATKKQIKEMLKDKEGQKKFKKEQDDLEKELGL